MFRNNLANKEKGDKVRGILKAAIQELKEISQRGFCLFYLIIMVVALIGVSVFLSFLIRGFGLGGLFLEPFINIILFVYGVGLMFLYQFGIGTGIFYKVKESKSETKKSIWLGKTLAISLITYIATILVVCLSIPLINLFMEAPALYLPDLLGWIYLFFIFPLLCFFFNALIGIIHLSAKDLLPGNFVNLLIVALLFIIPIFLLIIEGGIFPVTKTTLIFSLATVCLGAIVCLISGIGT
jgi:hypothetical protein